MHLPKQDRYRQEKWNFLPSITIEFFRDLILYLTFDPISCLVSCFTFYKYFTKFAFCRIGIPFGLQEIEISRLAINK